VYLSKGYCSESVHQMNEYNYIHMYLEVWICPETIVPEMLLQCIRDVSGSADTSEDSGSKNVFRGVNMSGKYCSEYRYL
jgi:hypothetical protein